MRNQELTQEQIKKNKFVTKYFIRQLEVIIDDLMKQNHYENWGCDCTYEKLMDVAGQFYSVIIEGEDRKGEYLALDLYYEHIQDQREGANDESK